jgi:hypothetical protein
VIMEILAMDLENTLIESMIVSEPGLYFLR